ncbi:MAG TPA: ABC transporter ATP-binding protein [Desulfobacterales bacterium]|nr:ABC transporter ATP-binding protein [Desulfobacterales bacterium]
MDECLLKIKDLHTYYFTYAGVVKAVNGIDLSIPKGETCGIVGESGCGKSVTARSIMRLIRPPGKIVKGQILFNGQNILKLKESRMRDIRGNSISMIFQEPMISLNPLFRIGDQIAETIRLHKTVSKREARDRSIELLRKVGIPDPEKRIRDLPHQMSGGMQQRVMIAIALSCDPKIIIADEPTTALDVTIQAQILDIMNHLKEVTGTSILMITHDLGVIAEMAQSVAVMYAGKIVEYSSFKEIFTKPKHPYTIGLMDSVPKINDPVPENRMLKTIGGIVPNLLNLPKGCAFQERCDKTFEICREKAPPKFEVNDENYVRCWLYE